MIDASEYRTILADPPWRFQNRTGKVAPEHGRLYRYETMSLDEICRLPIYTDAPCHLYLWVPVAMIEDGLQVMDSWGFTYKTIFFWEKVAKDGTPDGRGVGFYFRNVMELLLFGTLGKTRTLKPGRSQVNVLRARKSDHSRKPTQMYPIIEACSPGPYLELFARDTREGWDQMGDQL